MQCFALHCDMAMRSPRAQPSRLGPYGGRPGTFRRRTVGGQQGNKLKFGWPAVPTADPPAPPETMLKSCRAVKNLACGRSLIGQHCFTGDGGWRRAETELKFVAMWIGFADGCSAFDSGGPCACCDGRMHML